MPVNHTMRTLERAGRAGRPIVIAFAAALFACAGEVALAQSSPPASQPVRRGRAHKAPLIDLEKLAQGRRPGQVMPGDPPPERFAQPASEPAPAAAAPARPIPIEPAPARDEPSGRPIKPAPTPVDPDSGPRGMARPAGEPRQAVIEPAPAIGTGAPSGPISGGEPRGDARVLNPGAQPAAVNAKMVRVVGGDSSAQWRAVDGAWEVAVAGAERSGRLEARTGLDGEMLIDLDGRVEVRVLHLSKVVLERRSAESSMPTITIERGGIELRANSAELTECWIRTPDRAAGFSSLPGVRIAYSAFSGTAVLPPSLK